MLRRFLLSNVACEAPGCTCLAAAGGRDRLDMGESLSLMWSYVVTSVDMCLAKLED